jgi:broad specificity polyphosphatase/5'/3'-nucleotidase SurE
MTYLTVAVPRVPPDQVRGVRIAPRAHLLTGFDVNQVAIVENGDDGPTSIWSLLAVVSADRAGLSDDISLYGQNWIVVTPMTVDEHADRTPRQMPDLQNLVPRWRGR